MADNPSPLEVRYSLKGTLKLFGMAAAGAGVCFGYTGYYARHFDYSPELYGGAWIAGVFFAIVLLISIPQMARRGVAVEFSASGIRNRRAKWPTLQWDQIARISFTRIGFADLLIIHPGSGFPANIKLEPNGTVSIGLVGLAPGAVAIATWLKAHQSHLLAAPKAAPQAQR